MHGHPELPFGAGQEVMSPAIDAEIAPLARAPVALPVRTGEGEGARADFIDNDGGEFGITVPWDPRDKEDFGRNLRALRQRMSFDPDNETSTQKPEWQVKAETLQNQYGFLPNTTAELSRADSVSKYIGKPAGAARYLNNILDGLRKNRSVKNHHRVVPTIVTEMGQYYTDASQRSERLRQLQSRLAEIDPAQMTDAVAESLLDPALIDLRQYHQILNGLHNGDKRPFGGRPETKRTVGEAGMAVIIGSSVEIPDEAAALLLAEQQAADYFRNFTIRELAELTDQAAHNHEQRVGFWRGRIIESRKHGLAVRTADKILNPNA